MNKNYYKLLKPTFEQCFLSGESGIGVVSTQFNLPIFLESSVDEMGVMVGFDGDVEQVDQLINFSYSQTGSTIQIYSTTNPDKLRNILDQTFTINWGDGNTSGLTVNSGIVGSDLPTISHTYGTNSGYTITLSCETPWSNDVVSKKVTIPKDISISNSIGEFRTVTISSYTNMTGQTLYYLNNLDYTNNTGYTTFNYLGIGGSRIDELKLYGSTSYSGVTTNSDESGNYSGYSFTYTGNTTGTTIVHYRDYEDGYTLITGNTTGFTKEEIFNEMITRNEHFLGFIDDPTIFSDIFVERGKQGVLEKSFRLSEIDNIGEIDIYGNGYFNVRKQ
jgi:hypothetical protein